jgi:hypothetical protein
MKKKINLVWDAWSKTNNPMPNGLHWKYRDEWETKYKNEYGTNVLTRFIPYDRYKLGFFPVLLDECNIEYRNLSPKKVHQQLVMKTATGVYAGKSVGQEEQEYWYVMEPNHMDLSFITENMFGNIDEDALKLLRDKKMKLIFYYAFEAFPFQQVDWMKILQRSLGWLGIPPSQFVLIFGDLNVGKNYHQFLTTQDQYYGYTFENIFIFDHFGWEFFDYLKNFVLPNKDQKEVLPINDIVKNKERPYNFLFLNGGGRPHRKYLITELRRQNLLDKGLWSYLNKFDIKYDPTQLCHLQIKKGTGDRSLLDMLTYHNEHGNNIEEKILDVNAEEDAWHNRGMTAQHYQDSYFNIVTETWPADPSFFVTEKIYKPIINLQPFAVCGLPGILRYLRGKGFETFPEWFVEDYDNVEGHKQRMFYLTRELIRIGNMDKKQLHKMYQASWEKCVHNRKHFFKFDHTEGFRELAEAISEL